MARRIRRQHMDYRSSEFGGAEAFSPKDEELDPMANITNLVDAMLVFACGLLIALITYWNLDLPDVTKVIQQNKMTEIENVKIQDDQLSAEGSSYEERGTVYEDKDGQMWLLEKSE